MQQFRCKYFFIDFQHTFWVPNAFTPNNDSHNDLFFPICTDVDSYRLQIFNRWGEVIFLTKDTGIMWDGRYKGEMMPIGSYPWVINYSEIEGDGQLGSSKVKSGSITIVQ